MAAYLITGGTGFVGTALAGELTRAGHRLVIVSRSPEKHRHRFPETVRLVHKLDEIPADEYFDGLVNLAGAGIADRRWSAKRRQLLIDSRVKITSELVAFIKTLQTKPAVMISGSAVGYYGCQGDRELDENSDPHDEFSHELCQQWESAAAPVKDFGIRLCYMRLGVVLGRNGGMLKRLLPPFYLGLGGKIGTGEQYISWIHLQDVVRGILYLLDTPSASGVFNLTAPQAVTNAGFTRALGKAMGRPVVLPLPAFAVRLLFGEMGDRLLLNGQNVKPGRLQAAGFNFSFPDIDAAFSEIFKK